MYQLYLDVYERSAFKLELLSLDFFRNFPAEIYTFQHGKGLLGFIQLYQDSTRLIFMFAGINYKLLNQYDIYLNLLIEIISIGISKACHMIDLGQTGEEIKLKLGCRLEEKFLHVHHSNLFLNKLVKLALPLFSYKMPSYSFNVFKRASI